MGWHCYLDDKIRFPFQAKCIAVKIVSPLSWTLSIYVEEIREEGVC